MSDILVRNLGEDVVERLKKRAKKEGRSLQAEVKSILERSALTPAVDMKTARKLSERFRRKFRGRKFPDSSTLVREDRER